MTKARAGWLAYEPRNDDDVSPPARDLQLRVDEYGNPSCSDGELGEGFEHLHAQVGISRLYDDAVAWHECAEVAGKDDSAIYARQQEGEASGIPVRAAPTRRPCGRGTTQARQSPTRSEPRSATATSPGSGDQDLGDGGVRQPDRVSSAPRRRRAQR